jgi:hypothetical protein
LAVTHGLHEDILQYVVGCVGIGQAVAQVAQQFALMGLPG